MQAQADLAVGANFLDEALFFFTGAHELEDFVLVDQAPMLVVDDGLEAHVRGFGHQQIHFLARGVVGRGFVQVAVQARGRGDATGVLVEIDMHNHILARRHLTLLFGERQQQVFRQPPVQEYADAVDFNNFQTGEFTDLNFRFFSSCDEFVIAVQINKNVEPVFIFGRNIFWNITIRQKDFAIRATVQI
ncbi:hypothetical protein D3C78_1266030 [compost metagenome]